MGSSCGFSALDFRSRLSKLGVFVACLLMVLLAIPPQALAKTKPLNATTAHSRILKRGIDNPIGVELSNGIELMGRIIAINTDSFTIQLFNDPEPVTVNYATADSTAKAGTNYTATSGTLCGRGQRAASGS